MQELNNMIEFSKMVMFSDVTTELEAVKQFIKTTDNIKSFQEQSIEGDMSLKEIHLAIEDICSVISYLAPKEISNTKYSDRTEVMRVNALFNLGEVLAMINAELSNYISINDLWEDK